MDHWISKRAFEVVERSTLRELSGRSDLRGALKLCGHFGACAAATLWLLVAWGSWWVAPAFIAQGILINCLYAGQHELSHWTVFKTRWLNDLFGRLCGFVTFNPFLSDRWAHFAHHRHTQDPELDPDLIGMPPYTLLSYVLDLTGVSFWGRRCRSIVLDTVRKHALRHSWLTTRQAKRVSREARFTLAAYAALALASGLAESPVLIKIWIGPLLALKWFHQLQNTGEHVGLSYEPDTFHNTRTLTGPPIVRWLMWNMSYHSAHHSYPGVPFFALPELHRRIVESIGVEIPTRSYLGAQADIFRMLISQRRSAGVAL